MMNNYSSEYDYDGISYASSTKKTDDEADGVVVTAVTTAVSASDVTETEANNTNNTKNTNNPAPTYKPPIKKKVSYSSDVDGNTTQASSDFLSASDVEVSSLNNSYSSRRNNNNNKDNSDFNSSSGSLLASSISNLTASMRGISNSKSKREKEMKKEAQRSNSKKINKATYDNDVMLKDLNEWVGKTKQSCNSVTVSKVVPVVLVVLNICDYTSSQSCRHALFCLVSLNANKFYEFIHSRIKQKLTAVQKFITTTTTYY